MRIGEAKRYKVIGGKKYELYNRYENKKHAKADQRKLKNRGVSARIITIKAGKVVDGYILYSTLKVKVKR